MHITSEPRQNVAAAITHVQYDRQTENEMITPRARMRTPHTLDKACNASSTVSPSPTNPNPAVPGILPRLLLPSDGSFAVAPAPFVSRPHRAPRPLPPLLLPPPPPPPPPPSWSFSPPSSAASLSSRSPSWSSPPVEADAGAGAGEAVSLPSPLPSPAAVVWVLKASSRNSKEAALPLPAAVAYFVGGGGERKVLCRSRKEKLRMKARGPRCRPFCVPAWILDLAGTTSVDPLKRSIAETERSEQLESNNAKKKKKKSAQNQER